MRRLIRPAVAGLALLVSPALTGGCSHLAPCTVSPIEIEETREDVGVLQGDLLAARKRAKELRDELAAKQAEYASKKDKPDELRKRVEELKKGSGRDDSQKKSEKKEAAKKDDNTAGNDKDNG